GRGGVPRTGGASIGREGGRGGRAGGGLGRGDVRDLHLLSEEAVIGPGSGDSAASEQRRAGAQQDSSTDHSPTGSFGRGGSGGRVPRRSRVFRGGALSAHAWKSPGSSCA